MRYDWLRKELDRIHEQAEKKADQAVAKYMARVQGIREAILNRAPKARKPRVKKSTRKPMSAAARKAIGQRMRAYWAKRRQVKLRKVS